MNRLAKIILKNLHKMPSVLSRLRKYSKNPDKYTNEQKEALLDQIVTATIKSGNINIEVYGKENIPQDPGFMFTPNHQGLYDGFAMFEAYKKIYSPVIKKELVKMPVGRKIFEVMGSIYLDRESAKQAIMVIRQTTEKLKKGITCLIFPEGTRSKNGNQIGEFKGGSFKACFNAKCPIVPVAFIDSFKPFDEKGSKKVTVQVHILKPLAYDDYKEMTTNDVALKVQNLIQDKILEYDKKD